MRKRCLDLIHDLAKGDERISFVGSDLGHGTLAEFRDSLPEQFFMEGINEAAAVGMAAGLALEGRIVYLNTIATFIVRRALEQVAVDLCMHKARVRLVGNGGGLVYAPLGSTHLAVEDIALMRALPNMAVVCPCDAEEMARLVPQTVDWPGPLYIRLAKGYDPVVSRPDLPFAIGRGIPWRSGKDVLLVTTGVTLQQAAAAAETLAGAGVEAGILHLHTVKPLDRELLLAMAGQARAVVTVEEHTLVGGLGSCVAEALCDAGLQRPMARLGIPDIWPDFYGSQADIMARLGLDAPAIARTALDLLDRNPTAA